MCVLNDCEYDCITFLKLWRLHKKMIQRKENREFPLK